MPRLFLFLLLIVFVLTVPLAVARYLWAIITAPARALRMALAYDRFLNTSANGSDRESISSRAAFARDERKRWACVLCRWLDSIDHDHCNKSRGI